MCCQHLIISILHLLFKLIRCKIGCLLVVIQIETTHTENLINFPIYFTHLHIILLKHKIDRSIESAFLLFHGAHWNIPFLINLQLHCSATGIASCYPQATEINKKRHKEQQRRRRNNRVKSKRSSYEVCLLVPLIPIHCRETMMFVLYCIDDARLNKKGDIKRNIRYFTLHFEAIDEYA